jgi:hypothetical protein
MYNINKLIKLIMCQTGGTEFLTFDQSKIHDLLYRTQYQIHIFINVS